MASEEFSKVNFSEAEPFLRYEGKGAGVMSADSDSASCGDACECGSGAEGCAHVPEQPRIPE